MKLTQLGIRNYIIFFWGIAIEISAYVIILFCLLTLIKVKLYR